MEKKKWLGKNIFKRKYTLELMQECIEILNKRNVTFKLYKSPYIIGFKRGNKTFIFYITSDRWATKNKEGKTICYYSKGLEDFLDRFLLKDNNQTKNLIPKIEINNKPKKYTIQEIITLKQNQN